MANIKFISYTGRYPNLCNGVLTLEIDGEVVCFGHNYDNFDILEDGNYDSFWTSGGSVSLDADYNEEVKIGVWELVLDNLDERFWDIADELIGIFNKNVKYGCCGGCV